MLTSDCRTFISDNLSQNQINVTVPSYIHELNRIASSYIQVLPLLVFFLNRLCNQGMLSDDSLGADTELKAVYYFFQQVLLP